MPYTVEASFDDFYKNINLNGDHREIANSRMDHLKNLLSGRFDIIDSIAIGSITKFTALKDHADVDIMLVLHYSKHIKDKIPSQVLQELRNELKYKTTVRENGQAVTLYYDTWPSVDIVPVSRTIKSDGSVDYYNVPDSNTENWIKSNPVTHAKNISDKASVCGNNFRRIIKMIKWWNITHGNFLQSFHIEVMAYNIYDINLDDTAWNVFQFFDKARPLLTDKLWYLHAYIDDYLTYANRQEALKRFDAAIATSRNAWWDMYAPNNNLVEAIRLWKQIFGDKYPVYG